MYHHYILSYIIYYHILLFLLLNMFVNWLIVDALNTRKSATEKHSPYTAVFGQKHNNLNNIDFSYLNCPMEESVERFLSEIDNVQRKVPFDRNKNNPSDITHNRPNTNEHKPKPKLAPRKLCKYIKPVSKPLAHTEKPIPKPRPKFPQADR